jgi:response regulator NasT
MSHLEQLAETNCYVKQGPCKNVVLIEAQHTSSSILKKTLLEFGYHIAKCAPLNSDIMAQVVRYQPDMLILATDKPNQTLLKTLAEINKTLPLPIIIFAEKDTPTLIKGAIKSGVSAYIVSEVIPQHLNSIISVASERFKSEHALREELQQTKAQLESRKCIEKAKGIIMEQKQLNEQKSYDLLRKMAMDQGKPIAQIAKNIIDVQALLSCN